MCQFFKSTIKTVSYGHL